MKRLVSYLPTLLVMFVAFWVGIDWTFLRDLSGNYTYYGAIPTPVADGFMGVLLLLAGTLMLIGLCCRKEFWTRLGYIAAGLSYTLFAGGLLLSGLLDDDMQLLPFPSNMTPGWNYLVLGVWMFFTATHDWEQSLDPHA